MQEERFWLLVSLKLSGEATPEELEELDMLLKQLPEMGLQYETFSKIWVQKHAGLPVKRDDAFSKHLQRLSNHFAGPVLKYEAAGQNEEEFSEMKTISPLKRYRVPLWIISGVAASVIAFFFIVSRPNEEIKTVPPSAQNIVSTKAGSKSKILLPDGTQVWLNADSKLIYNGNFSGSFREVQLMGEAYFDVVKDKNHPFIIHAASIDVKVLGTAFNVRSYSSEKITETALFRGSVEITMHNNPEKKIILKPNEKLVVQNNSHEVSTNRPAGEKKTDDNPLMVLSNVHFQKTDSTATEILWMKNKLAFDGETLEDVALKIGRWYNVKVNITDERFKNQDYHYHAVFDDESLEQVMEALHFTGNFKYTINRKEVTIMP
jgi:transmembrane sensor